jgi:hypothetical protein
LTEAGNYYFVGQGNKETSELIPAGSDPYMVGRIYLGQLAYAAHSFRMAFAAHYTKYYDAHPRESALPNIVTIDGISIGHSDIADPATATWVTGRFGGSAGAVVDSGAGLAGLLSDDVIEPGGAIAAGRHIWAMVAAHVPSGGAWPQVKHYVADSLGGLAVGAAEQTGKLTDGSAIALPAGTVTPGFAPTYIVAKGSAGEAVVLTYGDSIAWCQYDSFHDTSMHGHPGFIQRGLAAAGVSGHSIAVPAAMGSHWARNGRSGSVAAKIDLVKLLPNVPFTHMLSEVGTNDCDNWPDGDEFIAGQKAVLQLLRSEFPGLPLYQTTLLPRGETADMCTTSTQQTPAANTALPAGNLALFNAALLASDLDGTIDGHLDINTPVADPAEPRKFRLSAAVLTLTASNTAGVQQIEAAERPRLGDVYYIDRINREVVGFSGDGPYRVELNGPVASAHPAGTVFRSTNSHDFLHPSSQGHRLIAPVVQAWAESLTSSLLP